MDQTRVAEALGEVRDLVAADGGDIELVAAQDGAVALRLLLEGAECRECVMPREFLEQIALDMMGRQMPEIASVSIDDPRESE